MNETNEETEVIVEKKPTLKDRFLGFCKKHPDVILTVLGGIASLAGGILKVYANKTEYEDSLFTTFDDDVYKVPAKRMKTVKDIRSDE